MNVLDLIKKPIKSASPLDKLGQEKVTPVEKPTALSFLSEPIKASPLDIAPQSSVKPVRTTGLPKLDFINKPVEEGLLEKGVNIIKEFPRQLKPGSELRTGLKSGVYNVASLIQRADQVFYDTVGLKGIASEMEKYADAHKEIADGLARQNMPINDERTFYEKLGDPKWFYSSLGQTAPTALASLGVAVPAAIVGAPVVGVIGAGVVGGSIAFGDAYQSAKDKGVEEEQAKLIGGLTAVGTGLLEAVPAIRAVKRIFGNSAAGAIEKSFISKIVEKLASAAKQGASEAGTESVQTIYENALKQTYDENQTLFAGVPESALFGGILGGATDIGITAAQSTAAVAKEIKDKSQKIIEESGGEGGFIKNPLADDKGSDPLIQEARKYKSAEEFANKAPNKVIDELRNQGVRGAEQRMAFWEKATKGMDKTPVIDSLNPTGGLHVDYTPEARMKAKLAPNITTLDKTMGKSPDDIITIYRGAPKNQKQIAPGDFVTTNYDLAKSYTGDGNVLSKKVKLSDVLDDINEPLGEEYLYRPKSQLTDIWNKATAKKPELETYQGEEDLTTNILQKLEGRSSVSKQFISDLTNSGELKQAERDLVREVLAEYPDGDISVKEFADKVKSGLLPLKPLDIDSNLGSTQYESIALPDEVRGNVANYKERIYESPITTSAADVHFSQGDGSGVPISENYFAHTRIEDIADVPKGTKRVSDGNFIHPKLGLVTSKKGTTRRVIEIQSDLFQKGRLESEDFTKLADLQNNLTEQEKGVLVRAFGNANNFNFKIDDMPAYLQNAPVERFFRLVPFNPIMKKIRAYGLSDQVVYDFAADPYFDYSKQNKSLEPYRNTWHERVIREEIKQAAKDGKTKLQFPTGETALKIEGLNANNTWALAGRVEPLEISDLEVGIEVADAADQLWVITDLLVDGKFKAVPKNQLTRAVEESGRATDDISSQELLDLENPKRLEQLKETFDISGKVDTNNPIYRFYEKEVGRYLSKKYGAVRITDPQGVSWYEVNVSKDMANKPVMAFKEGEAAGNITPAEAKRLIGRLFDEKEVSVLFTPDLIQGKALGAHILNKNLGGPLKNIIQLVEQGGKVSDLVAYHESFHAYFRNFIEADQAKIALEKVKKEQGISTDKAAEEWLADDFARYAQDQAKYRGGYRTLFKKILDTIRGWLRKFDALENLYNDILEGKRTKVSRTYGEGMSFKEDTSLPSPTEGAAQKGPKTPGIVGEGSALPKPRQATQAANRFYKEVLAPKIQTGEAIVIGADDMKDHFGGDYDVAKHNMYSRAAFELYNRLIESDKNPVVKFTGGGPGAGKTDVLIPELSQNFTGIIYDSNFSNFDGAKLQIEAARKAGKEVQIYAIIPDLEQARIHTIIREKKTGRAVSDAGFAKGHANFIDTLQRLLSEKVLGPGEVNVLDIRKVRSYADVKALAEKGAYPPDPLAILNKLGYREDTVLKIAQYESEKFRQNRTNIEEKPLSERPESAIPIPSDNRPDKAGEPATGRPDRSVFRGEVEELPEINYSTKADRLAAERANDEFRRLEIKQAIKDAEAAAWGYRDQKLEGLKVERAALKEALANNPARGLMKYVSKKTGRLPEVTGSQTMRSVSGSEKIVKTSEFGLRGDDIVTEFGYKDVNAAQAGVDKYVSDTERLSELDANIRERDQIVRIERKQKRDEIILNRVADKLAKQTEKFVDKEAEKKAYIKRLKLAEEEAAKKIAQEELQKAERQRIVEKAHKQAQKRTGLFAKFKRALGPIGQTDSETIAIYKAWKGRLGVAKELANETYDKYYGQEPNDFGEIIEYEAGKKTPWMKEAFDDLWTEGRRRGLETAYREDYVPHVYNEKPEVVKKAIAQWLKDEGLEQEVIDPYLAGEKELPESFALRLKLKPFFVKTRTFPDYVTAFAYGLTPKFTSVAEHLAYYREQMEKTLANKALINELFAAGKILDAESSPESWVEVRIPGERKRTWYAPKDLADGLNGQFDNEADMTLAEYFVKFGSGVSKFMQDIKLSAGVPFTPINFFAIGQANLAFTSFVGSIVRGKTTLAVADARAAFAWIRSFSDTASRAWLKSNEKYITMMEREGINLGQRLGHYDEMYKTFRSLFNFKNIGQIFKSAGKGAAAPLTIPYRLFTEKGWKSLFGPDGRDAAINALRDFRDSRGLELVSAMWNKAISSKTFDSLIPQLKVTIFKGVYEQSMKSGLMDGEAQIFAANMVKNSFGHIEDMGRGKFVKDAIGTFFFAPRYRESIVNLLYRSAKGITTNRRDNTFIRNRSILVGTVVVFTIYQLLNWLINKDFTWENEKGREFSIKLPLPNGDIMYFDFMPSVLAFPRNMAQGTIGLVTGDLAYATQKFGSLLSSPINVTTESLSNQDYFGRPIYKDTDSPTVKGQKVAEHVGLAFTHPFVREMVRYFQNKEPMYQALSIMAELPIKYSNITKAEQSRYYEALEKIQKTRAEYKAIIDLEAENRKLVKAGRSAEAASRVDALTDDEYEVYKAVKLIPTVKKVQKLVAAEKTTEAQKIVDELTDDEYRLYQFAKENLATPAMPPSIKAKQPKFGDNTKTSETSLIKDVLTYAKAIGSDPVTAFDRIFSGQRIRRVDNGAIIVERMSFLDSTGVKKSRGATTEMRLDHAIPLQLGGDNSEENLVLVPTAEWESYTPIENYLGKLLRSGKITKKSAQDLMKQFKEKKLTADEVKERAKNMLK